MLLTKGFVQILNEHHKCAKWTYLLPIILEIILFHGLSLGIYLIFYVVSASHDEQVTNGDFSSPYSYLDLNLNLNVDQETIPVNNDLFEVQKRLPESLQESVIFVPVK